MLSTIDVVIIIASMLFVISVGAIAGRKRGDTAHGYFLGGNKMPWWLIGTAFVATGISSEQMIGTVGITYDYGMAIGNWEWFALPCYTMVLVFFIPIYLKNKVTTVSGFMSDRFGPAVGTTYSCILLILYICVYMVTVLYAGSLAFSNVVFTEVTWWKTLLVLLFIAVGVGAYTIHGGLTSVMWADLFQCILLMVGGITLFWIALSYIPNGWAGLVEGASRSANRGGCTSTSRRTTSRHRSWAFAWPRSARLPSIKWATRRWLSGCCRPDPLGMPWWVWCWRSASPSSARWSPASSGWSCSTGSR